MLIAVLDQQIMFNDPLSLNIATSGDPAVVLSLVDGPTNRRTVRTGVGLNGLVEFTIGHQPSSENGEVETVRTVVRHSLEKTNGAGKPVKVYAQIVISHPTDNTFDASDKNWVVACLISFLQTGGDVSSFPTARTDTDILAQVTRLLNQEP